MTKKWRLLTINLRNPLKNPPTNSASKFENAFPMSLRESTFLDEIFDTAVLGLYTG